ncbi:MAG: type II toxin-antitoxin system RelE/ParE family toxin [Flavobacteriales bacterium]
MNVIWTRSALDELKGIYDYYLENVSFQMAENIRMSVLASTKQLAENPLSGVVERKLGGSGKDYRSVVRGRYKVIYRIDADELKIVDVFDTRQNPPKLKRHVNASRQTSCLGNL